MNLTFAGGGLFYILQLMTVRNCLPIRLLILHDGYFIESII